MNISREEKKIEAINRMKMMKIIPDAIKQFKNSDKIMVSEPPIGGLYYIEPELQEFVNNFEKENDALVFLVVRAFTNFGKMDSLLFVSDYKEEWEMDRDDIRDNICMSYTINYDMPDCSEFGSIGYKKMPSGSILRVF